MSNYTSVYIKPMTGEEYWDRHSEIIFEGDKIPFSKIKEVLKEGHWSTLPEPSLWEREAKSYLLDDPFNVKPQSRELWNFDYGYPALGFISHMEKRGLITFKWIP